MTTPILPESIRSTWRAWNAPFEGTVDHLYLDTHDPPLVTIGVGNLVDPVGTALSLPFMRPDGSPASRVEILAEWSRVKAMRGGLRADLYASPTGLHLEDDAITALVLDRLDANAAILAREFPGFADWPASAQAGASSVAWACGAGWPRSWPHLSAACRSQAWVLASECCEIKANAARSTATAQLFRDAADAGS